MGTGLGVGVSIRSSDKTSSLSDPPAEKRAEYVSVKVDVGSATSETWGCPVPEQQMTFVAVALANGLCVLVTVAGMLAVGGGVKEGVAVGMALT